MHGALGGGSPASGRATNLPPRCCCHRPVLVLRSNRYRAGGTGCRSSRRHGPRRRAAWQAQLQQQKQGRVWGMLSRVVERVGIEVSGSRMKTMKQRVMAGNARNSPRTRCP